MAPKAWGPLYTNTPIETDRAQEAMNQASRAILHAMRQREAELGVRLTLDRIDWSAGDSVTVYFKPWIPPVYIGED